MNTTESVNKAFQLLGELMNEDCFDFWDVEHLNFSQRKSYIFKSILQFFNWGEINLAGLFNRQPTERENLQQLKKFDEENPSFFADVILLMDEDVYTEFQNKGTYFNMKF